MFIPLINKPTRITAHSAALIDNIFTNNFSDKVLSSILINDISDNLPILSYLFDDSVALKNQLYKPTRNYNEANINSFRICLSEVNWSEVLSDQDPNDVYNKFHSKYSLLYEKCFPWEKKSNRYNKESLSPWITRSLLVSIQKRKKLYRKLFNLPNPVRESQLQNL
jgi:hypothetical protein